VTQTIHVDLTLVKKYATERSICGSGSLAFYSYAINERWEEAVMLKSPHTL
jgi:hypothetical protein